MAYYGQRPSGRDLHQASGGNPFYNPYSPYPNIGMGIASTFGNIMAMKEMRAQQDYDRGEEEKKHDLETRRVAAYEKSQEPPEIKVRESQQFILAKELIDTGRANTWAEAWDMVLGEKDKGTVYPTEFQVDQATRYGREDWKDAVSPGQQEVDYKEWMYKRRSPQEAPQTNYTRAVAYIEGEVQAGRKTPEEARVDMEKITGLYEEEEKGGQDLDFSGGRGAPSREANQRSWLARKENTTGYKDIKQTKKTARNNYKEYGQPPTIDGIRTDMPLRYQMAVLNERDGVATPIDTEVIQNYEDMWGFFEELVTADGSLYTTWSEFTKHPDFMAKDIDKKQMKFWYDAYGKLMTEK